MIDGQEIIDFHGHVGRWDIFEMNDDADEILYSMDAAGIDRSCMFNIFHPDGTTGNDQTAACESLSGEVHRLRLCLSPDVRIYGIRVGTGDRQARVFSDQDLSALFPLAVERSRVGPGLSVRG
jgi:hypothetical protein